MKRIHIIIIAAALFTTIIIVALYSYLGSGWLEVSAPAKTPADSKVSVEVERGDAPADTFSLQPGETRKIRLKKGTLRINAAAGGIKSVDIVRIKPLATTRVQTPSGKQMAVERVGSHVIGCPLVVAGKLYSYTCGSEGPVLRSAGKTAGQDRFLFNAAPFAYLAPVKDGLIGFHSNQKPFELDYINLATETIEPVPVPEAVQTLITAQWPLIITAKQPGDSRFLLLFNTARKFYLFKDVTDTNPVELKLSGKAGFGKEGDGRIMSFNFSGDRIVQFAGVSQNAYDGRTEGARLDGRSSAPEESTLPSYIFEYDMSGKLVRTINLPETFNDETSNMYKLPHNFYAANEHGSLTFHYYNGQTLQPMHTLQDIGHFAVHKNTAYVQAGGTVYEFVPGTEGVFSFHSLFSSEEAVVSELFSSPLGMIFTAFTSKAANAPVDAFVLGTAPQQGNTPADIAENPVLNGTDALLERGLSSLQLLALQEAYSAFLRQQNLAGGSPRIDISNVATPRHGRYTPSETHTLTFDSRINNKTSYTAKVEYTDLNSIRLYVYDSNRTQLFDSAAAAQP